MSALDTYTLEHYLNFVNDGTGLVRIDEPVGFDAGSFTTQQEKGRLGRDVYFGSSGEKIDFTFVNQEGKYETPFNKLIEYRNRFGSESEVNYVLREDSVDYVMGELDYPNATTDLTHYFKCTVIQDTESAKLKRRIDAKVDQFSDEDLDGNPITPIQTSNILLKAKPVVQKSSFNTTLPFWTSTGGVSANRFHQNAFNSIVESEIKNTIIFIDRSILTNPSDADFYNKIYDTGWIDAENDIVDVTYDIQDLKFSFFVATSEDFEDSWRITPRITFQRFILEQDQDNYTQADVYPLGGEVTESDNLDYTVEFIGIENISRFDGFSGNAKRYDVTVTDEIISNNQIIPRGYRLSAIIEIERENTIVEWLGGSVEIKGTSIAIPSVTKGTRFIDVCKQTAKSINPNFTIDSPRYDNGGEHYDNFCFSGNMVRGRTDDDGNDVPFVVSWKDIESFLPELFFDYQVNDTEIFIGNYSDYYQNTEIGAFELATSEDFFIEFNEKYKTNKFKYKYKKFNQDKDDDNTIDSVHTEAEFLNQNTKVENTKNVEVVFIRDPFMLETTRIKGASAKPTTSLSQDDDIFIFEVVPIAPNSFNTFSASMTHYVSDGNLQLLNDGSFNWLLLGFGIGDNFAVANTDNALIYTVEEITQTILTLSGGSPTFSGVRVTEVTYPLSNVQYTIRTNEGFDSIEGLIAPDDYGNLRYSIKRNILEGYGSYLATSTIYKQESIKNTYFKNDPSLVSQFNGGDVITEASDITQDELSNPLLTPNIINTKVLCTFSEYRDIADRIKTDRGFIRVYDSNLRVRKGFPELNSYLPATGELNLILEEKYESEFTDVSFNNGIYTINEVGYPTDILPDLEYIADGDYIQFFDAITRPLTNNLRYDYVTVEGVAYNNIIELVDAIEAL